MVSINAQKAVKHSGLSFPTFNWKHLIFCCMLLLLVLNVGYAQTLEISKQPLSLIQDGKPEDITVEITETESFNPAKIKWNGLEDFVTITSSGVEGNKATYTFLGKSKSPKKNFTVKYELTEDKILEKVLTVEVKEKVAKESLKFNVGSEALIRAEGKIQLKPITQNIPIKISVTDANGGILENSRVRMEKSANITSAEYNKGIITITVSDTTQGNVEIFVDDNLTETLSFQADEAVKSIAVPSTKITLEQNDVKTLKQLEEKGFRIEGTVTNNLTGKKRITDKLTVTSGNSNIKVNKVNNDGDYQITAENSGEAILNVRYKDEITSLSETINFEIVPRAGELTIQKNQVILYPNKSVSFSATVKDITGKILTPSETTIKWELISSTANIKEYVSLNDNDATDTAELVTLQPINAEQTVTVKATLYKNGVIATNAAGNVEIKDEEIVFVQKLPTITDFALLKINLDVVDDITVKDDWGKQLRDNYFVTKIELINVINKRDKEYYADPILVYNQTLEVMVAFEYLDPDDGKTWKMAEANDSDIIIPVRKNEDELNRCVTEKQTNFILPYRPLDYDTALLTFESRENRSFRNKFLKGLQALTSLASFVTALTLPGAVSELPYGLDSFNSLLIPSYEKLFPDKREIRRNNIIKQFMLPLEEVAFGSQITKYLLFPKQPIRGLVIVKNKNKEWKPVPVRIRAISSSDACARVAVIKRD